MDVSYNNNYQIFEISTCYVRNRRNPISFNKSTIQLQFELDLRVILFQISEFVQSSLDYFRLYMIAVCVHLIVCALYDATADFICGGERK